MMKGERSFEAWAQTHGPALKKGAFLLTGNEQDAIDLAQDVLVRVFVRWRRVSSMALPEAYARRIMINLHLSHIRRAKRHRERQHLLIDSRISEDQAGSASVKSMLESALRELGEKQRAVVVLRYYFDMPDAEIAGLLNCSEATVRSQASRALEHLRANKNVSKNRE